MSTSTTWGSWKDRATYLVAEAQFLLLGLVATIGVTLVMFRPELPGVPPIVVGWLAAITLLGPLLFGFFVWLVKRLRRRNMVEVHHVNAITDEIEKYYVEPDVWAEKSIDGANPYPINGASAWAVREFDWLEDVEELTVQGVWLEETEDVKLLTSKSHMEAIYEKLTESHIALQIFRDSVSEFGADIQRRLINRMAESRERGKMMDKGAVSDVFEDFEDSATDFGPDDLPTLEPDEDGEHPGDVEEVAQEAVEDVPTPAESGASGQPAATDGGADDGR